MKTHTLVLTHAPVHVQLRLNANETNIMTKKFTVKHKQQGAVFATQRLSRVAYYLAKRSSIILFQNDKGKGLVSL